MTVGNFRVPPIPENLTYDAEGNLDSDGKWKYTWSNGDMTHATTQLNTGQTQQSLDLTQE
jgi:hypothetical protein